MVRIFKLFIVAAVLVSSAFIGSPLFAAAPDDGYAPPPVVQSEANTVGADGNPSLGWGTYSGQYLALPASTFFPRASTTTYDYASGGYVYRTGGDAFFMAPITLPQGVYLDGVRLYYYDNSANNISVYVARYYDDTSPSYEYLVSGWTTTGTPGYTSEYIAVGHTIQYSSPENSYVIWVNLPDTTSTTMFKGVRLFYHLQISPAPATASFSDVPTTHPFFQYIEALYASRITTGYGSTGTYHPDDPVTRGQMAAFLARALGLQW
jgi:hypothetical protein